MNIINIIIFVDLSAALNKSSNNIYGLVADPVKYIQYLL